MGDVILGNISLLCIVGGLVLYFKAGLRAYAFIVLAIGFMLIAINKAIDGSVLAFGWFALVIVAIIRYRYEKEAESRHELGRALQAPEVTTRRRAAKK
jgi:hypothetical protein